MPPFFDLATFTIIHTAISLLALAVGIGAVAALFKPRLPQAWTNWFLILTGTSCVTGFMFPLTGPTPAVLTGVVALAVLVPVLLARYRYRLAGLWRKVFTAGMVASVFFQAFVTVAQAFAKLSGLHPLAPTGTEPPFAIAEGITLLVFVALGVLAVKAFDPKAAKAFIRRG